jgi:hypothetical protein
MGSVAYIGIRPQNLEPSRAPRICEFSDLEAFPKHSQGDPYLKDLPVVFRTELCHKGSAQGKRVVFPTGFVIGCGLMMR